MTPAPACECGMGEDCDGPGGRLHEAALRSTRSVAESRARESARAPVPIARDEHAPPVRLAWVAPPRAVPRAPRTPAESLRPPRKASEAAALGLTPPKASASRLGDWVDKGNGGCVYMPRDLYFALPTGVVRDVAFYLCARLTNDGYTKPTSVAMICTETRLSRRSVQRALRALEGVGVVMEELCDLDGTATRFVLPTAAAFFGEHGMTRPPRARRRKVNPRKVAEALCRFAEWCASL